MKVHVVDARPDVCLISDRHAGLLQSILKLQHGTATTPPLWPDVQNKWCIRHMGANFYDHFNNKDLKRLCTQNQQRKFNALWQMLYQLTAELVKVRASGKGKGIRNKHESGYRG